MASDPTSSSSGVLFVLSPIRIYPRFETRVAGAPIEQLNWSTLSTFQKLLLTISYGQYTRANPRDSRYMLSFARDIAERQFSEMAIDLLAFGALPSGMPSDFHIHKIWTSPQADTIPAYMLHELRECRYSQIILLYPDAIGYGWGKIEVQLSPLGAPLIAATGRRRIFELSGSRQRAIYWRRFLEQSWLIEWGVLFGMAISYPVLLVIDVLHSLKKRILPARSLHG